MDAKTGLEELRKPHPDQARIDAESAQLLLSSARWPGGRGARMPGGAARRIQRWPGREDPAMVNGQR
jgi:hypothetical protein